MARVNHPGQRTFWHLRDAGRVPSNYDVVSSRLHYGSPPDFEVRAPLAAFFGRYQASVSLSVADWELFSDPAALTYADYVGRRRDDEQFLARLLDSDDLAARFGRGANAALREFYVRVVSPLRFPCHGLQMAAAYLGHLAPSSKITIAATFQAGDELRRVQRLAYRLRQVELVEIELDAAGRAIWQEDEAWQPLRRLIEMLLVTYDWGEAFTALNLLIKPAFDQLLSRELAAVARQRGDDCLSQLLVALGADGQWQRAWSQALLGLLLAGPPGNRQRIVAWVGVWRPRLLTALRPLVASLPELSQAELDGTLVELQRTLLQPGELAGA
jgi:toluene monooxygenase system protein E